MLKMKRTAFILLAMLEYYKLIRRSEHLDKPSPVLSIRLAVFTVSPKRQYRGIFKPTTPAHTGPNRNIYRFFA